MSTIQPSVVMKQNLDYMQAEQESLELQVEHWASAGGTVAGGMLAAGAWTQPGHKASEDRQDWLESEKKSLHETEHADSTKKVTTAEVL